jgi:hypothetical protein
MLNGNQISTIVLLCILGLVIFCLTKSESLTNTDNFANAEQEQSKVQKNIVVAQSELLGAPQSGGSLAATVPQNKVITQEVIKQIVTESESKNQKVDSVFNFEGNDLQNAGANLDSAFARPIDPTASTDKVAINDVKKYDAKDFLPKEINDEWFDTDFSQAKYNVNDDKLINTERYVIGVNTVGQSLKNASYDIRGTIPNPKFSISPWNNSTYEPDFNLKPLC